MDVEEHEREQKLDIEACREPASGEIFAVTNMDEEEREVEHVEEEKLLDIDEIGKRVMTEISSNIDRINEFKHSSDRQQVGRGGSSGFYKVPEDMRRRAGSEAAALYDPKHVNFWKIRELFEKDDLDDNQTRNQVRHYDYHLRSYANYRGYGEDIVGFMQNFYNEIERIVTCPIVGSISMSETSYKDWLGAPLLWANIFLLDLFHRYCAGELSAKDDPECAVLWVSDLWADFLLLENQIPLLIDPRDLSKHYHYGDLFEYFNYFIPLNRTKYEVILNESYRYHHILHLIHYILLPSHCKPRSHPLAWFRRPEEAVPSMMKPVPSATRLQQAGIKFKPVDDKGFVVEFKRGVLKLPRLNITKCTKKVLMNLIVWEICHTIATKYFINYAILMDQLVNTSKDVEILIQSGVFEHSLATDEEVVTIFNGLSQDLVYTENELENKKYNIFPKLTLDINNYCKSRRNVWWANLMQDYFNSPWSILSLIAALLLILLTLAQTFFSAYSYFRPPK